MLNCEIRCCGNPFNLKPGISGMNNIRLSSATISPVKQNMLGLTPLKQGDLVTSPAAGLPTCTDFRGTYRFRPSITISRFHAVVYRFWKMREFLRLSDFVLFCFRQYSRILPHFAPTASQGAALPL